MGRSPLVARSYTDVIRRLGVRKDACSAGHVVLVATAARSGAEALASLSELAMVAAYTNAKCGEPAGPPTKMRISLIVVRQVWNGDIRAMAQATRLSDRAWLLDCELREVGKGLLSIAFASFPLCETF
jgi:hypothetical protein